MVDETSADKDGLLATLVARRNDIAHGKKVFIRDMTYYHDYEQAVDAVMVGLALAVVGKAESSQAE